MLRNVENLTLIRHQVERKFCPLDNIIPIYATDDDKRDIVVAAASDGLVHLIFAPGLHLSLSLSLGILWSWTRILRCADRKKSGWGVIFLEMFKPA